MMENGTENIHEKNKLAEVYQETGKGEAQKLKLRKDLTTMIKCIICIQLLFFDIVVFFVVSSVIVKDPFFNLPDKELSVEMFRFLMYYIGVTMVELIGMLWLILRHGFLHKKN